jgi:hypothetical protein
MEGNSPISLKPGGKSAELIPQHLLARELASRVELDLSNSFLAERL